MAFIDALQAEANDAPATVGNALNEYRKYLEGKGNKQQSIKLTCGRLQRFLASVNGSALDHLNTKKAQALYDYFIAHGRVVRPARDRRYADMPVEPVKPLAADSHRNYLLETRSFFRWCVKREWIKDNPFEKVEGKGRRSHGKAQLRVDEARKFLRLAFRRAAEGDAGACAGLIALYLGLRASEITHLLVRDLDDDGWLLWIADSKTPAGRRTLDVPPKLRDLLLLHARGKTADKYLFPAEGGGPHWRDWPRECIQKLCKAARVPTVTAHSMRGLASTLAAEAGVIGRVVADALGHEDYSTTEQSYAAPGAVENARRRRGLAVIDKPAATSQPSADAQTERTPSQSNDGGDSEEPKTDT